MEENWEIGDGDVYGAIERMAIRRRPGALLSVEADRESLELFRRRHPLERSDAEPLHHAWDVMRLFLPAETAGKRVLWSRFQYAIEGDAATLLAMARRALRSLHQQPGPSPLHWHLVFIEVFLGEPLRTLHCDPGYDLAKVRGKSAIAWVKPCDQADWQESQRYPTVTFHPLDP